VYREAREGDTNKLRTGMMTWRRMMGVGSLLTTRLMMNCFFYLGRMLGNF